MKPIERLGRPKAKNPQTTRSTSSGPVATLSQWRSRTADDDADEVDEKADEDNNDEATHSGHQKSNSGGESPTVFGKNGQRTLAEQLRTRAKRARGRKNLKDRKAAAKAATNLENDIRNLKVQVVVSGTVHTATTGGGRKRATDGETAASTVLKKSRPLHLPSLFLTTSAQ